MKLNWIESTDIFHDTPVYSLVNENDFELLWFYYEENIRVTNKVLDEVHATQNRIVVMNKCDLLNGREIEENERQVLISAKTGKGIEKLKNMIYDNLYNK